ncbi:MAG: hypothetical protein PSV46_27250 [Reyranella sp.]|nr:hypothetical protein [Reyranella sp.]
MQTKILATISLGLLAAACSSTEHRTVSPAYGSGGSGIYQSSTQACLDYGFVTGTVAYSRCVTTEQAARANYRPSPGYAPSLVASDAQNACYSYGITPNTPSYNRCVAREIDVRTYRDTAAAPGYRVDAEGYRVDQQGYRVDANGYRLTQPTPYYTPAPEPQPTYQPGQTVYRDEFGNRYDGQGNRVNASGQIIPMRPSVN